MTYAEKDSTICFEQNEQLLSYEQEIKELNQYKEAYNLMCDETWSLIPDEEKSLLHKKLNKIFNVVKEDKSLKKRIDRIALDCEKATIKMAKVNKSIAKKNRQKD